MDNKWDLIVIGSGMGGMTLATIMASIYHKRVLVLERDYKVGGFTHTFRRPNGYKWDVGVHYIGEMGKRKIGRRIFDFITDGQLQWEPLPDVYDVYLYPDHKVAVPNKPHLFAQQLAERFPQEAAAINNFFDDIRITAKYVSHHYLSSSVDALPEEIETRGAELAAMTTGDYLSVNFKNDELRAILASIWGNYGLPPGKSSWNIHAQIVSHYLRGAHYPVGGADQIAKGVVGLLEAHGGQVLTRHHVSEILVQDGKATGVVCKIDKGERSLEKRFFADQVVSSIGAYGTYKHLLPNFLEQERFEQLKTMMDDSCSALTLYLGMNDAVRELGFQGENYWIYDSYDHDAHMANPGVYEGKPSYCYLNFPGLKDPSATKVTAEITVFINAYDTFKDFRNQAWRNREEAYQELKARITKGLIDFVDERFPGFADQIDFAELGTPLSVEHFLNHHRGAIYGLPTLPQRYQLDWLDGSTPLENFYLTGVDVGAPGILGAALGGMATAGLITGDPELTKKMFYPAARETSALAGV